MWNEWPAPFLRRCLRCSWIVGVFAFACGQAPPQEEVTAGPAEAGPVWTAEEILLASTLVGLPPTGIGVEDLPDPQSSGAQYLARYCVACHALPSPAMHSATDWPSVLRRMWLRMGRIDPKYGITVPEVGDQLVLLRYLIDHSLKVSDATLPDAPGRERFMLTCAECHELPDPKQHSPGDWFVVVQRMNGHMREILGLELEEPQVRDIVLYLEKASTM